MASVNSNTPPSTRISAARGSVPCASEASACVPHELNQAPNAPPISARIRLSVSNCRTRPPRVAPTAIRTAISRLRPKARDSRRLATLAHAINSTSDTAANRTSTAVRTPDTISSCRLPACTTSPGSESGIFGFSARYSADRRSRSACAVPTFKPGFRRATRFRNPTPACTMPGFSEFRSNTRGATMSVVGPKNANRKSAGSTPMMV